MNTPHRVLAGRVVPRARLYDLNTRLATRALTLASCAPSHRGCFPGHAQPLTFARSHYLSGILRSPNYAYSSRPDLDRQRKPSKPTKIKVKEIQLTVVIAEHDLRTKVNRILEHLSRGHHVRLVVLGTRSSKHDNKTYIQRQDDMWKNVMGKLRGTEKKPGERFTEGKVMRAQVGDRDSVAVGALTGMLFGRPCDNVPKL